MEHGAPLLPNDIDAREPRERGADQRTSLSPSCPASATDVTDDSTRPADAIIDRAAAMERFEGDVELMGEIADLFLEACPQRLQAVREALAHRDSKALQFAAHSLKGAVSNFAAAAASAAALRLELIGRSGDLTDAGAAYAALDTAIAELCSELRHLKDDFGPH